MAKETNPKKNKHLTQEDRIQIEEFEACQNTEGSVTGLYRQWKTVLQKI